MITAVPRLIHIGAIAVLVTRLLPIAPAPYQVHGGVGRAAFDEVRDTLVDWTQGTLGKIIAGAMVPVGISNGRTETQAATAYCPAASTAHFRQRVDLTDSWRWLLRRAHVSCAPGGRHLNTSRQRTRLNSSTLSPMVAIRDE